MPMARRADADSTDVRQGGCNAASGILTAALTRQGFAAPVHAALDGVRRYAELEVGDANRAWRPRYEAETGFHGKHAVVAQQKIGMTVRCRCVQVGLELLPDRLRDPAVQIKLVRVEGIIGVEIAFLVGLQCRYRGRAVAD